jgi:hypothetical protein
MAITKFDDKDIPKIVKKMRDQAFPNKSVWAKHLLDEASKTSYFSQFISANETEPKHSYTQLFWCRTCEKPVDNVEHNLSDERDQHEFNVFCHGERISCALSRSQLSDRRNLDLFPVRVFPARSVTVDEHGLQREQGNWSGTERGPTPRRARNPIFSSGSPSTSPSASSKTSGPTNAKSIAKSRPKPKEPDDIFGQKPPKKHKRSLDL